MSGYTVPCCSECTEDVVLVADEKPCTRCGGMTRQRVRTAEVEGRQADIANLAADLMRIVVNTNMGIPGKPGGEVARQLVRECRALYEEVDKPTQPPKQRAGQQQRVARTVGDDDEDGAVSDVLDDFTEGEIDK